MAYIQYRTIGAETKKVGSVFFREAASDAEFRVEKAVFLRGWAIRATPRRAKHSLRVSTDVHPSSGWVGP